MLIDITPLRNNRDYRLLFIGQLISFLGSMVTYMAVPYQVYELTHSNAMVGTLGLAQLLPVLIFGLLGGAYADRINRRRLMLVCESLMAVLVLLLLVKEYAAVGALSSFRFSRHLFHRHRRDAICVSRGAVPRDGRAMGRCSDDRIAVLVHGHRQFLGDALQRLERAGWVAAQSSVSVSLWSGGLACMVAVGMTSLFLPKFWAYRANQEA
jgi:MFS family permease